MEIKDMEAAVEAVLFAMGEAVPVKNLASMLDQGEEVTRKLVRNMMTKYDAKDRGIEIIEIGESFQLCTKKGMYEHLIQLTHQPKKHVLTDVVLETLSIIAYKQPVTRSEIERIRGVSCSHAINKLMEYNLVEEAGRLDAPGKPILFGTTEEFLRSFGVKSPEDLPIINPEQVETFKNEAEEEVGITV